MRLLLCLLAIATTVCSCTHYYYSPNVLQIPILQHQHDASLSVGRYSSPHIKGIDVQAIYSPVKYTGVMFNYMGLFKKDATSANLEWGHGRLTEGGLGLYYPYKHFTLSLFAGYGGGWVENGYQGYIQGIDDPAQLVSRLEFRRWFVQPSLGFRYKWLRMGFGARHIALNYVKGDIDYRINQEELTAIRNIEDHGIFKFWEKGLSLGLYLDAVSLTYNAVWTNNPDTWDSAYKFNQSTQTLSIGLNIQELWRKSKEK